MIQRHPSNKRENPGEGPMLLHMVGKPLMPDDLKPLILHSKFCLGVLRERPAGRHPFFFDCSEINLSISLRILRAGQRIYEQVPALTAMQGNGKALIRTGGKALSEG